MTGTYALIAYALGITVGWLSARHFHAFDATTNANKNGDDQSQ